ncbi:hypothetical protein LINPERPRIM_LOCUS20125 [Linum perenne]
MSFTALSHLKLAFSPTSSIFIYLSTCLLDQSLLRSAS